MDKAIQIAQHLSKPLADGEVAYDCDFSKFQEIVKQMNEMGAPVEIEDLIFIIENRLSGGNRPIGKEKFLVYTFICKPIKVDEGSITHSNAKV